MKESNLHNFLTIADCVFGTNVKLISPYNLYGCRIGNYSFVGPFTEIQKNVSIGDNTTISSHTFICEHVSIGNNCFIGHGVMFTNDKFDDLGNEKITIIGNNVKIGSNATILPITIGDNCIIGAGSVVTKDVPADTIAYGNPAKFKKRK
jgi:acetyltransferase-like isoleucine patch superfamily enzyme